MTAAQTAGLAAAETDSGMLVSLTQRESYPVYIGRDLDTALPQILADARAAWGSGRVHVITDPVVARHYLGRVASIAARSGFPASAHVLPAGEDAKASTVLPAMWHEMRASGTDRRTLVLAVGGGTVCDAATFAAATYMRSLPYALVPTTLIAQADAAIGGKGGADFEGVKNLIGTFYHPAAVVIDPALLRTLDERHVSFGLAEIIKIAVICDSGLFELLEAGGKTPPEGLDEVIRRAIRRKLDLLAADPLERGSLARALNYGHCVGHPIEAASGYTIHHGEAVAMGMATAAAVGTTRGRCPAPALDRIARLLARCRLPLTIPGPLRPRVWEAMSDIRRIRNGPLNLVVPVGIGACAIVSDISRAEYEQALGFLDQREADQVGSSHKVPCDATRQ